MATVLMAVADAGRLSVVALTHTGYRSFAPSPFVLADATIREILDAAAQRFGYQWEAVDEVVVARPSRTEPHPDDVSPTTVTWLAIRRSLSSADVPSLTGADFTPEQWRTVLWYGQAFRDALELVRTRPEVCELVASLARRKATSLQSMEGTTLEALNQRERDLLAMVLVRHAGDADANAARLWQDPSAVKLRLVEANSNERRVTVVFSIGREEVLHVEALWPAVQAGRTANSSQRQVDRVFAPWQSEALRTRLERAGAPQDAKRNLQPRPLQVQYCRLADLLKAVSPVPGPEVPGRSTMFQAVAHRHLAEAVMTVRLEPTVTGPEFCEALARAFQAQWTPRGSAYRVLGPRPEEERARSAAELLSVVEAWVDKRPSPFARQGPDPRLRWQDYAGISPFYSVLNRTRLDTLQDGKPLGIPLWATSPHVQDAFGRYFTWAQEHSALKHQLSQLDWKRLQEAELGLRPGRGSPFFSFDAWLVGEEGDARRVSF